jgi:phosphate transport system substrate-binding protein
MQRTFASLALLLLLLAGCAGSRVVVDQAGSSTVYPIAQAWSEAFGRDVGASIVVGGGGSGAGLARFCRGELDIADASRPIKATEVADCKAKGIEPFEIQVAVDGLSVVVAASNTFVHCLTTAQLHQVWTADAAKQAKRWKDLDADWPDEAFELFGPGTDSGTFEYFVEAILAPVDGKETKGRSDYTPSEDDNVLVQGVASSPYALGYFGLAYAREHPDKVRVVGVDEGKGNGCVEPTDANVEGGKYHPLARPLFMYTDGKPAGVLKAYFEKGLSQEGQDLVAAVKYIRMPAAKLAEMQAKIA